MAQTQAQQGPPHATNRCRKAAGPLRAATVCSLLDGAAAHPSPWPESESTGCGLAYHSARIRVLVRPCLPFGPNPSPRGSADSDLTASESAIAEQVNRPVTIRHAIRVITVSHPRYPIFRVIRVNVVPNSSSHVTRVRQEGACA